MNILFLIALIIFIFAAFNDTVRDISLTPIGLAFLTAGMLWSVVAGK